jgi:transcriptional regulator with XRE-family HTH domain
VTLPSISLLNPSAPKVINSLIREQAYFSAEVRGPTEMLAQSTSFGQAVAKARKAKGLSQKELAALIVKDEGGGSISPQYLNDIEHDRRSPTSDHLIKQFAKVLDEDEGYLFVLAGKIPDDIRKKAKDRDKIVESFANFRRTITK